jgi:hypothetical protein
VAQIVFIINDEDGAVNVTAAAEPYIPVDPEAEVTPAQQVAQLVAAAIHAALSPREEETPKLEVVGNVDAADGA